MSEINFPNGIKFEKPKEGTPDFIKGKISINVLDFSMWMEANKNERGWINIDLKKSKEGKLYLQLNDYKPATSPKQPLEGEIDPNDINY